MINNPLYRHPSMQLLRRAILREKRLQLGAAVVFVLLGLVTTYYGFLKDWNILLVGIFALLAGTYFTYRFVPQQDITNNYLLHLLFYQPDKIVWVYGVVTQHRPFGFNTTRNGVLYFYLIDGDSISVSLSAQKLKQVSFFLNRMLPRAVFGYTEERARQYARDPQSLLRS